MSVFKADLRIIELVEVGGDQVGGVNGMPLIPPGEHPAVHLRSD